MADVKVTKAERKGEEEGRALSRRGELFPSLFPLSTRDFFSTSPFSLMRRLTEDMDRAFSTWIGRGIEEPALWMPAIEVQQKDNKLKVVADLPGINKDDVKVEVTDDSLIIQGERKHEEEEKREGYYHSERTYGNFYRSIPLPEGAKIEDAQADFKNGCLEVTIPVPEAARKARQVPIRAAAEEAAKKAQAA